MCFPNWLEFTYVPITLSQRRTSVRSCWRAAAKPKAKSRLPTQSIPASRVRKRAEISRQGSNPGTRLSLPLPALLQTPLEGAKQICISESPNVWIYIRIRVIITVGPKVLGKHFNRLVPWLQIEELTWRVNYLTPSSTPSQGYQVCLFQGAPQSSLLFDTIIPAQCLPLKKQLRISELTHSMLKSMPAITAGNHRAFCSDIAAPGNLLMERSTQASHQHWRAVSGSCENLDPSWWGRLASFCSWRLLCQQSRTILKGLIIQTKSAHPNKG